MNKFKQLLHEKPFLLADGATGTNLFKMGLQSGDPPEFWNIDEPEKIKAHYRSFVDAGSDIILTNSFGGNRYRLMLHKAENRVNELNSSAVKLAAEVIKESGRTVAIAGCIGPTGEILEPIGSLTYGAAIAAFAEQCESLANAGADVIWIETMSSMDEIKAAVFAASSSGLPLVYTASLDTNGKTMMGLSSGELMSFSKQLPIQPDAIGTNCGVGAAEVVAAIKVLNASMQKNVGVTVPLVAKANCGIPEFIEGEIRYNGTPELMANYAIMARNAGARIIGGCCGTTPAHIASMRWVLDAISVSDAPTVEQIEQHLGPLSKGIKNELEGREAGVDLRPRTKRRKKRLYR